MSDCSQHTKQPDGYIERSNWAEMMSKTHTQVQCDQCGLWAIWIRNSPPKKKRRAQEKPAG